MLEKKLTPLGRLAARQLLSQLPVGFSPTSRVSIAAQSAPRSVSIALQSAPRIPHHACRSLRNPLHATCRLHMQSLHVRTLRVSIATQSAPRGVSIASAIRSTHSLYACRLPRNPLHAACRLPRNPLHAGHMSRPHVCTTPTRLERGRSRKLGYMAPGAPAVLPQVLYGATHVPLSASHPCVDRLAIRSTRVDRLAIRSA